jgi:hypothetical protein
MKKFILAFTAILSIGMAAAFANYTMTLLALLLLVVFIMYKCLYVI